MATFRSMFGRRSKTPAVSAPRPAPAAVTRESATKAAREEAARRAREEEERRDHEAWIAAGLADMERQRAIAEREGCFFPEDWNRGGLAEIALGDGQSVDLDEWSRRRRWRRAR